jgi:DNA-binding IclR family transcriptional regulator
LGQETDKYVVPALQRGLALLALFTRQQPELNGAELARRLGLPRASVFRLLHTLERASCVQRVGDSANYRLGVGVLRLGFEYLASMEMAEHGRPILETLRDGCGYSAHLCVRDGTEVVVVAKAAGHSALFNSLQVGTRLPAHATVLGRVLLADLSLKALSELYADTPMTAFTAKTPTTVKALSEQIEAQKKQGYAISQGGFESGISTIAAAVRNEQGGVGATLSVTVPAQQIGKEQVELLVPQVLAAARALTARLCHIGS